MHRDRINNTVVKKGAGEIGVGKGNSRDTLLLEDVLIQLRSGLLPMGEVPPSLSAGCCLAEFWKGFEGGEEDAMGDIY